MQVPRSVNSLKISRITRTRTYWSIQMPPTPRMHKPNATINLKNVASLFETIFRNLKKSFPLVCKACRDKLIDRLHIAIWSIFTPLYSFEKISAIGQKFEKLIRNLKKAFHLFVELVETNPLIYSTLHFDHYSRLDISLIIFRFLVNNSKTNLK